MSLVTRLSENDKAEALKNQGNTYYDLGQYAQAIDAYQNALKLAPQDPVIYNNLGAAYFSLNRNREAGEAFKKSVSIKKDDPDAYFNLGISYSAADQFDEALDAFMRAVQFKPDWGEAHTALGDTYPKSEQISRSSSCLRSKQFGCSQTTQLHSSNLGYAYDRLDKADQSIQALRNAVRLKSDDAVAFNNLGAKSLQGWSLPGSD